MRNPFFSIITISYNQSSFLFKCLASISSQSLDSYEHILVDPGSTDGSRAVIESYPSNLVVPVFEHDSGPPDGLNHGVSRAIGEYLLFINSDDYLLENALSLVYCRLQKAGFPDIMFLGGYVEKLETGCFQRYYPGSISGNIHALGLSHFFQQGTAIKTELVRKLGGFNTSNRTCWDGELFLKILANPLIRAKRCKDAVAVFVIHPNSITGSGQVKTQYQQDFTNTIRKYYNNRTILAHNFISNSPRIVRLLLKYILDPRLAYWKCLQAILGWLAK